MHPREPLQHAGNPAEACAGVTRPRRPNGTFLESISGDSNIRSGCGATRLPRIVPAQTRAERNYGAPVYHFTQDRQAWKITVAADRFDAVGGDKDNVGAGARGRTAQQSTQKGLILNRKGCSILTGELFWVCFIMNFGQLSGSARYGSFCQAPDFACIVRTVCHYFQFSLRLGCI